MIVIVFSVVIGIPLLLLLINGVVVRRQWWEVTARALALACLVLRAMTASASGLIFGLDKEAYGFGILFFLFIGAFRTFGMDRERWMKGSQRAR